MDSYTTDIELEFEHWLANVPNGASHRAALAVGYFGGRVDGATCREQYATCMDLFKESLKKILEVKVAAAAAA